MRSTKESQIDTGQDPAIDLSTCSMLTIERFGNWRSKIPHENEDFCARDKIVSISNKQDESFPIASELFEKLLGTWAHIHPRAFRYRGRDIADSIIPYNSDPDRISWWPGAPDPQNIFHQISVSDKKTCWFAKLDNATQRNGQVSTFDIINTVTGFCLFGTKGVSIINNEGKTFSLTDPKERMHGELNRIKLAKELSIYEVEAILRLTSFLTELSDSNPKFGAAHILLPGVQYYLYAIPERDEFSICDEVRQQWMDGVDARISQLKVIIEKYLVPESIRYAEPLSPVGDYLRVCMAEGRIPELNQAIDILMDSDALWKLLLRSKHVSTWRDLNYASYVHFALAPSFFADQGTESLTLQVDSPHEEAVLTNAREFVAKAKIKALLAGIYPHERVIIPARDEAWVQGGGLFHAAFKVDENLCTAVADLYGLPWESKLGE